jgi:two-component system, cell cycle response regulator
MLGSVLTAAAREVEQLRALTNEMRRHRASFNLIESCKFQLRTLEEAEGLAAFAAHCFPEPDRVVQGIAELLVNAVEHGNLEIGYARKSELIEDGTWRAEIERRSTLSEYKNRHVEVTVARRDDGVYIVVTDQGGGFNWQRYMTIDPARAGDNHGRGIAQANALSFDRLTYNAQGNQAVAFVGSQARLEW